MPVTRFARVNAASRNTVCGCTCGPHCSAFGKKIEKFVVNIFTQMGSFFSYLYHLATSDSKPTSPRGGAVAPLASRVQSAPPIPSREVDVVAKTTLTTTEEKERGDEELEEEGIIVEPFSDSERTTNASGDEPDVLSFSEEEGDVISSGKG